MMQVWLFEESVKLQVPISGSGTGFGLGATVVVAGVTVVVVVGLVVVVVVVVVGLVEVVVVVGLGVDVVGFVVGGVSVVEVVDRVVVEVVGVEVIVSACPLHRVNPTATISTAKGTRNACIFIITLFRTTLHTDPIRSSLAHEFCVVSITRFTVNWCQATAKC